MNDDDEYLLITAYKVPYFKDLTSHTTRFRQMTATIVRR